MGVAWKLQLVRNTTLISEHIFQAQMTPDFTLTDFGQGFHYDDNTTYTSTTTVEKKNKANKKHAIMSRMLENMKT